MRLEREPESADDPRRDPTTPIVPLPYPLTETAHDRPPSRSRIASGAAHKLEELTRLALHDLKRVCWKRPRVLLQAQRSQQPASGSGHRSKLLCAPQAIGHREEDAWWGLMGYTQSVDRREERFEEDRPKDAIGADNYVPRGGGDLMW